jgi:LmbE family N-acetylglucosaminyl deacetylase
MKEQSSTIIEATWKMRFHAAFAQIVTKLRSLAGRSAAVYALPERITKPPGSRVLVIAPHPDDETIGCGGTLYKHALARDEVVIAFMTDGSKGDPFCIERGDALVLRRKREARGVQAAMGTSELVFLDHPDTHLSAQSSAPDEVASLLDRLQPDILYVPSFLDTHVDHRATFDIAALAVEQYGKELTVYIYEVLSPIPANCVVEIDIEKKVDWIRLYTSQLDEDGFNEAASRSLAKYRAISNLLGLDKFAECFWRCTAREFILLARHTR